MSTRACPGPTTPLLSDGFCASEELSEVAPLEPQAVRSSGANVSASEQENDLKVEGVLSSCCNDSAVTSSGSSPSSPELSPKRRTGHTGYTYWKRDIPDAHLLPPCVPKRIHPREAIAASSSAVQLPGASVWNAQGLTWEKRDVSKQLQDILMTSLTMEPSAVLASLLKTDASASALSFQLADVTFQECEGSICYTRGKPRFGYQIALEAEWILSNPSAPCADRLAYGQVRITDLADFEDVPDVTFTLSSDTPDDGVQAAAEARHLVQNLQSRAASRDVGAALKHLMKTTEDAILKSL